MGVRDKVAVTYAGLFPKEPWGATPEAAARGRDERDNSQRSSFWNTREKNPGRLSEVRGFLRVADFWAVNVRVFWKYNLAL